MKRVPGWAVALLVAAAVVGSSLGALVAALALPGLRFSSPHAEPRAAVHQIFDKDDEDGASSCSGVMIAPMRMLTAAHCIKSGGPHTVAKERAPAKVLRMDEALDVALLSVALDCPCAPIAVIPPALDEPVLVVGFPMNQWVQVQVVTEGRAQGTGLHLDLKTPRLRLSVPVAPGNSGGGAFVSRGGSWQLVGILTNYTYLNTGFAQAPLAHLSAAAGLDSIRAILAVPAPEGVSTGLDL